MTGCASHFLVWKHKWKACLGVICRCEYRRDPSLDIVATLASAAVSALKELTAVRVWLVAIGAVVVGNRGLEVCALVAGEAGNFDVFP